MRRLLALLLMTTPVLAQHRTQDMPIHELFYETWMMPDNRKMSCCHKQDCQPAASKFENGQWWARWEDMPKDQWWPIPASKVEKDRDTPDGRSHMCGRKGGGFAPQFTVYCFIPGGGA
jgi:hypothetical protein